MKTITNIIYLSFALFAFARFVLAPRALRRFVGRTNSASDFSGRPSSIMRNRVAGRAERQKARPQSEAPKTTAVSKNSPRPAAREIEGKPRYGIPGRGGRLVGSPYTPNFYVDVRGVPPGTKVLDTYANRIFLIPWPAR